MKKQLLQLGMIAAAALCGLQLSAKPAKPGLLSVPTADGSHITVRLTGDEFYHQYFTEDGYPLFEKEGNFYYCNFDANGNVIDSGIKAGEKSTRTAAVNAFLSKVDMSTLESRISLAASRSPRRASLQAGALPFNAPARAGEGEVDGPPYEKGYGLFPDLRFPAYGDQKAIVILVEYTDVKFNKNYPSGVTPYDYFNRMLNEDGFDLYGGTGSAAQYFRENSNSNFRPQFDVYGPVTLSRNQAYYGGNNYMGNDQHPADMVKEACEQLDSIVDFRDYDRNGDGVVDNVFVFYAGRGEASGGSANTVWPHSWNMASAGYGNLKFDGVRIHTYGCTNEWENQRPDGVGTFIHEFSHVMGLPDLYATSYTSSFTPGEWSALDYGPYNNNGMTPPNYGAFERYALGWIKPREIDRAVTGTLQPITENVCGVIRTPLETEFFLVENRQQHGWDAFIPGHGMLVWHIQYDSTVWQNNVVNNTPSHQYVDIEEADGTQSDYSRGGDCFPGTAGKTAFTSETIPAMKTWLGTAVDYPITDIAESDGVVTFNVLGGAEDHVDPLGVLETTEVGPDAFTLNWEAPAEGNDVIVNIYRYKAGASAGNAAPAEEDIEYLTGYRGLNVGNVSSIRVTNADPETEYHFTIRHSNGWYVSEVTEGTVTTGRYTIDYYAVVANEAADISSEGFTASWEPMNDAVSYEISLYSLEPGGPEYDANNFDEGLAQPYGWSTDATGTYSIASYSGENVPSLRLADGNSIKSPTYDDYVKTLSFWTRGNTTTIGDVLRVIAVTADGNVQVDSVLVDRAAGGQISEITSFPEKTLGVILEFCRKGATGALAIDDIVIGHGLKYTTEPIEGMIGIDLGDVTDHQFTGLNPATFYSYQVRATDGTLFSLPSQMIIVQTKQAEGVGNVAEVPFALEVNGLNVTASTGDAIVVSDFAGMPVARGAGKVTLPRAGLYIISVPAQKCVRKVIVR